MFEVFLNNDYRFNDRLSVGLSNFLGFYNRDYGFAYVSNNADSVITGLRNRRTAENVLNVKYSFNNRMGLTFRLRHYWSKVDYTKLFNLMEDGNVEDLVSSNRNPDINLNLFNIDMNFSWQFAPGSFINLNWKSFSGLEDQFVNEKYYSNLRKTFDYPQAANFSVKVIYYLDYLQLKKKDKPTKGN
jgi:hypothetical protein